MPIQAAAVRRVWRTVGFGLIALVIWLSLTPQPIEIPVKNGDKLGHVAAYATLMFWFAQLDTRHRMRLAYAIGFVMLGVALEFAQRLTDYRTFEVADMGADAVGVPVWLLQACHAPHFRRASLARDHFTHGIILSFLAFIRSELKNGGRTHPFHH